MLRALMASASGCITLSLALHATLLWGASRHERSVERRVAVDLVTDAIALGFESRSERLDGDERSAGVSGAAEEATAEETPEVVPAARPQPPPEVPRARRAERSEPPKRSVERTIEKPPLPEPTSTKAEVAQTPSAVSSPAASSAASDAAQPGAGVAGVLPAVVPALPGSSGSGAGSGNGAGSAGGVGSARADGADGAARRAALLDYARRVRARIAEHREYPYAARRARASGTVCLRIELAASGRLLGAQPTCGGSLGLLAKAALSAVAKAAPFPPLPAALGPRLELDVPIIFEIED